MSSNTNGPKFPVLNSLRNASHRFSRSTSPRRFSYFRLLMESSTSSTSSSQKAACISSSLFPSGASGTKFVAPSPNHASGRSFRKKVGGVIPGTSRKYERGLSRSMYSVSSRVIPGVSLTSGKEPRETCRFFPRFLFRTELDRTLMALGISPRSLASRSRAVMTLLFPTLGIPTVSAALLPFSWPSSPSYART
ncbi:hypothetical protein ACHAWF_011706 [Thalassiosira exigua]